MNILIIAASSTSICLLIVVIAQQMVIKGLNSIIENGVSKDDINKLKKSIETLRF